MMGRFTYVNIGLALVLVFVGAKMTLTDVFEIPVVASLAVVIVTLGAAVGASP